MAKPKPAAAFLDQSDERLGERHRFLPQLLRVHVQEHVDAGLQRLHAQDRRRARQKARDAGRGSVRRIERERPGVAEPAGDRLPDLLVPALGDEQERRRPGPAVQILVAAADRQIGAGGMEIDRQRRRRCARGPTRTSVPASCAARVSRAMSWMRPVR